MTVRTSGENLHRKNAAEWVMWLFVRPVQVVLSLIVRLGMRNSA
jgi:hypothetical protein